MSCSHQNCNLVVYYSDKCILHSDKQDKDIKAFWKQIRTQMERQNDPQAILKTSVEFDGVYFPEFEEKGLTEASRDEGLNFFRIGENQFKKVFKLTNCIFRKEADFHNLKFSEGVLFDKCIFENGLILKNMFFCKGSKVRIQNCPQIMNANFGNTTFEDLADFYNSTFTGSAVFEKTNFQDITVFSEATFQEDIDFKYTSFNKLAQFKNTKFHNALNLENAIIKEEINFLGIKKSIQDISIDVANRETARIIKHSFERQDNIIEANKFYAIEMKEREKELKKNKLNNVVDYGIFLLHGYSSNHSQEPILPLLWILNITYIYSMYLSTFIHNNILAKIIIFIVLASILLRKKRIVYTLILLSAFSVSASLSYVTSDMIADKINPFSIMTSSDPITFGLLIFKIFVTIQHPPKKRGMNFASTTV